METSQNNYLVCLDNVEDTIGKPAQQPAPDFFIDYGVHLRRALDAVDTCLDGQ